MPETVGGLQEEVGDRTAVPAGVGAVPVGVGVPMAARAAAGVHRVVPAEAGESTSGIVGDVTVRTAARAAVGDRTAVTVHPEA